MQKLRKNVLIRCDSSILIGTGHAKRSFYLAKELKENNFNVIFFCRNHEGNTNSIFKKEFTLIELSRKNEKFKTLEKNIYRNWLSTSEEQDAEDFLSKIKNLLLDKIDWIIIDHYSLSKIWVDKVKKEMACLYKNQPLFMAIDDIFRSNLGTEFVLNNNNSYDFLKEKYNLKKNSSCKYFFGPEYSLLEKQYSSLHKKSKLRTEINRILVFFGGIDKDNFTSIAIKALIELDLNNIVVDIVIGKNCPHKENINQLVKLREKTNIYEDLPSLSELILIADLAIGASGTHSWERSCLGLPSISIPVAKNQIPIADYLSNKFISKKIEPDADIKEAIKKEVLFFLKNKSKLTKMSAVALSITDGKGTQRLISHINGFDFKLVSRKSTKNDIYTYFRWVNDSKVRNNSFKKNKISFKEHYQWFNKNLACRNSLLLIIQTENDLPVGQIRFEKDINRNLAKISFSIDSFARGNGYGSKVLELGIIRLKENWPKLKEVYGEVEIFNNRSSRAFIKAGFNELESSNNKKIFSKKI